MNTAKLIGRSLSYHRRTNAAVVAGVAVAVAVLAGALLVGDSVRGSLRALFLQRIGRAEQLVTAESFFREQLAEDLAARAAFRAAGFEAAVPLVALEGLVVHDESGRRGANVAVYGVDERFWRLHGLADQVAAPAEGDVLLSPALAAELGARAGDSLRVRVEKPSAIPVESLHGRKDDVGRTVRLAVREVLAAGRLGEFAVRPQQGEVRAAFVALSRLQRETNQEGRANAILISGGVRDEEGAGARGARAVEQLLRDSFALEDLGWRVRALDAAGALSLESRSALVTEQTAAAARERASRLSLRPVGVFSYLANTMRANGREIPYSLVTAIEPESLAGLAARGPAGGETGDGAATSGEAAAVAARETTAANADPSGVAPILLNEWAVRDLGARLGDEIELDYYLWREEGRLETRTAKFRLAGVVPIAGLAADRQLTPDYPGISDTDSLSDWDPPFPLDLSRVRPQDEEYWQQFRTTPKGFIPLARGQELWRTRFGSLTSLRLLPPAGVELEQARAAFERELRAAVDPLAAGLRVAAVREEGLRAAQGATDFGEYFLYFSFFLVVSALLLASLFFKLGVEQRVREIGLLRAVGFSDARVRRLFLAEGLILSAAGSALGLLGALAYAALLMRGLGTWWVDAVGTRALTLHVSPASLAAGFAGGTLAALACVWLSLRALRRVPARSLLAGVWEAGGGGRVTGVGGWGLGVGRRGTRAAATQPDAAATSADAASITSPDVATTSTNAAATSTDAAATSLDAAATSAAATSQGAAVTIDSEVLKRRRRGRLPLPHPPTPNPQPPASPSLLLAVACGALGLLLLVLASARVLGETAGFFGAGVLLLVAALAAQSVWLRRGRRRTISGRGWWPVARLGFRGAAHRPARSVLCIALVASATFIIVAVDAFRQDAHEISSDRKSGGGGYALLAESLLPVTHDPNTPEGREALGLDTGGSSNDDASGSSNGGAGGSSNDAAGTNVGESAETNAGESAETGAGALAGVRIARFRVRPGDDASCLNLYRPQNPKLLGVTSEFARENRFSFQDSLAASADEAANPWLLLERDANGGAIPVAADIKSLNYVLHKKLGDEIELAGAGGETVRLRVVAALADSVFQSELLMSERNFLRAFPERQGYRYFLVEAPAARAQSVAAALEDRLADFGFDAVSTAERLASYHRVENTYLSTFQTLGALGVLLGTLGLAAVLLRNVFERRKELALLRAVGYGPRHFAVMVVAENAFLLLCGLATGAACALLAVAPALIARGAGGPARLTLALLLLAVLAAGLAASLAATLAALRTPLLPALRAE